MSVFLGFFCHVFGEFLVYFFKYAPRIIQKPDKKILKKPLDLKFAHSLLEFTKSNNAPENVQERVFLVLNYLKFVYNSILF